MNGVQSYPTVQNYPRLRYVWEPTHLSPKNELRTRLPITELHKASRFTLNGVVFFLQRNSFCSRWSSLKLAFYILVNTRRVKISIKNAWCNASHNTGSRPLSIKHDFMLVGVFYLGLRHPYIMLHCTDNHRAASHRMHQSW